MGPTCSVVWQAGQESSHAGAQGLIRLSWPKSGCQHVMLNSPIGWRVLHAVTP